MSYANDYPVRLVGGRLALDLVNTADWSEDGQVVHEKIESLEDLDVWLQAFGLPDIGLPATAESFRVLRANLRQFLRSEDRPHLLKLQREMDAWTANGGIARPSLSGLAIMSTFSIIADPRELGRIKTCPGENCGWMFVDETKNSRRTWCLMETCGNRAKAARHYRKVREERMTS
ncbi:CGNR zinc finger domain-containing protein [Yoonia sp. F2084L]|uniref:CGNR zinc finger domain-containing protein n=1 Tax=Yoonia sp. F2084L TaxID=2926419 RepID=UPI001FF51065|nr:CGNR zinc finger domain-containing protein [Yoonia sp. F2084L]MCK0097012.1 CGNR zinc finger domain-containing protein [Yoonia sp. F2084L]